MIGMNVLTRLALIGMYVAVIAAIGVPALIALIDAGHWPEPDLLRTGLTVVVPAVMLTVSAASRRHSLA